MTYTIVASDLTVDPCIMEVSVGTGLHSFQDQVAPPPDGARTSGLVNPFQTRIPPMTRLARLLSLLGLTQKQAALMAGMSRPTFAACLQGKRDLHTSECAEFCTHFAALSRWGAEGDWNLLRGLRLRAWLDTGDFETGRQLVSALELTEAESRARALLLAEPGRFVKEAWGDDLELRHEIATVDRDGITTTAGELIQWDHILDISQAG